MGQMKKALPLVFLFVVLLCLTVVVLTRQWKGKQIESWEKEKGAFRIRITTYEAKSFFLSGMYYEIESAAVTEEWSTVMTFRDDDQRSIPRDQIKLLDDKIGYVYLGWVYAVTTDGGKTWSTWNAEKDLPGWWCCNYKLVKEVQISTNGSGKMILNPIPLRPGEVPELRTTDFGRHWSV